MGRRIPEADDQLRPIRISIGSFNFDRNWTQQEINTTSSTAGAGFASFLLGLGSGGYMTHEPSASSASSYYAFYLQDDWKVSRN